VDGIRCKMIGWDLEISFKGPFHICLHFGGTGKLQKAEIAKCEKTSEKKGGEFWFTGENNENRKSA